MSDSTDDRARRASAFLRSAYAETIESIDACAHRVAGTWDGHVIFERSAVVEPFRSCLEDSGVLAELPAVLESLVDCLGAKLPATPVAGPPYVVVTSRGVILRATIEPGRLVVRIEPFTVTDGPGAGYRLRDERRVTVSIR